MDWTSPLSVIFPLVQRAVLHALWRRPGASTGRQVHVVSGVGSYPGTMLALRRLAEQGLVDARPVGAAVEYSVNVEHVMWPVVDAAMGAYFPRDRFWRNLRALLEELLDDDARAATAAFFGSFARGEATTSSDIDLLLVLPDAVDPDRADAVVTEGEHAGRRWTGNAVQVYVVTEMALERAVLQEDPIVASWRHLRAHREVPPPRPGPRPGGRRPQEAPWRGEERTRPGAPAR